MSSLHSHQLIITNSFQLLHGTDKKTSRQDRWEDKLARKITDFIGSFVIAGEMSMMDEVAFGFFSIVLLVYGFLLVPLSLPCFSCFIGAHGQFAFTNHHYCNQAKARGR